MRHRKYKKDEMKNQMNIVKGKKDEMMYDEMGYFFGFARGCFGEVLGELGRTKINSCRTSSIPLAEFWQSANLGRIGRILEPYLPDFNPYNALKFFEFPTDALFDGERIGRPSMTDIMILESCVQIAVEGKMTEYMKFKDQTVREWLDSSKSSTDTMLRLRVLRAWLAYIHGADATGHADLAAFQDAAMDVSYQFVHRAASACNKAGVKGGTMPVLVYHLFFDAKDDAHKEGMEAFKDILRRWAKTLRLCNMKFLIIATPVTNMEEVCERYGKKYKEIFYSMISETIYKFDFEGTTVECVVNA